MSSKGRCVVFAALFGPFVAVAAGQNVMVSESAQGVPGDEPSFDVRISADGTHALLTSLASNLTGKKDLNFLTDVFVRNLATGATVRVSRTATNAGGNGESFGTAISPDGRFSVYTTLATNLIPGDANHAIDVVLHDESSNTNFAVSVATDGRQADGQSQHAVPGGRRGRT